MNGPIQFKVCGLTRAEDAVAAADAGASFLGFIFYPKSPRCLDLKRYLSLCDSLPNLPKVAVTVSPSVEDLSALRDAGFDFFQIHFPSEKSDLVEKWAAIVGKERLWLAPKIAPDEMFAPALLEFADTILWDAYKKDESVFGGTGTRSDWASFSELRKAHPESRWVLAGGLSPENAVEAADATGALFLDFNSGLETLPGIKDQGKIMEVSRVLLESQ